MFVRPTAAMCHLLRYLRSKRAFRRTIINFRLLNNRSYRLPSVDQISSRILSVNRLTTKSNVQILANVMFELNSSFASKSKANRPPSFTKAAPRVDGRLIRGVVWVASLPLPVPPV